MTRKLSFILSSLCLFIDPFVVLCKLLDFLHDFDSIPFDKSSDACSHNSKLLTRVLSQNASNNILRFPVNYTFHFHHGIVGVAVNNSIIQLDGTLRFEKTELPSDKLNHPLYGCLTIEKSKNVTITSNYRGVIDGRGSQYWGIPLIGYIRRREHRPRLLRFNLTDGLLIENIILQDSPYHTLYLDAVNNVEIRHISIVARRTRQDGHGWVDLTAFNTDGIDVAGHNVWIHDCDIWVQDDCIAVKDVKNHTGIPYHPMSSNMTFERINATGLGFTIGSIQGTHVKNITFRDSYLHRTVKGIYMKFTQPPRRFLEQNIHAVVEDILYENITMEAPTQWPIWIGPAQQADDSDFCHPNPCSLCWPMTPGSKCHVVPNNKFRNITLRNVRINNPQMSTGVIYGSEVDTIDDIIFENVKVTQGKPLPISLQDIHVTFPGTLQPVHDAHVPSYLADAEEKMEGIFGRLRRVVLQARNLIEKLRGTYADAAVNFAENDYGADQWYMAVIVQSALGSTWMWLFLALFMGILTWCVVLHWRRFSRSEEPRSQRALYHWLYAFLLLVFFSSCICFLIMPFHKPKWQRTNRYFQCKGVNNGIARGRTWPVPPCFQEDRQWSTIYNNEDTVPPSPSVVATIVIFIVCLSFVAILATFFEYHPSSRQMLNSRHEDLSQRSEGRRRLFDDSSITNNDGLPEGRGLATPS